MKREKGTNDVDFLLNGHLIDHALGFPESSTPSDSSVGDRSKRVVGRDGRGEMGVSVLRRGGVGVGLLSREKARCGERRRHEKCRCKVGD
jgi:hypothetical protein